ncbi:hypothetical protein [Croceiramulus getboli]|nr:hypothetical protein P8624_12270 [Flavobacteriaceae bacterium YJPT1-3]
MRKNKHKNRWYAVLALLAILVSHVGDLHLTTHDQDNPVEQCAICTLSHEEDEVFDFMLSPTLVTTHFVECSVKNNPTYYCDPFVELDLFGQYRNRPPPQA